MAARVQWGPRLQRTSPQGAPRSQRARPRHSQAPCAVAATSDARVAGLPPARQTPIKTTGCGRLPRAQEKISGHGVANGAAACPVTRAPALPTRAPGCAVGHAWGEPAPGSLGRGPQAAGASRLCVGAGAVVDPPRRGPPRPPVASRRALSHPHVPPLGVLYCVGLCPGHLPLPLPTPCPPRRARWGGAGARTSSGDRSTRNASNQPERVEDDLIAAAQDT